MAVLADVGAAQALQGGVQQRKFGAVVDRRQAQGACLCGAQRAVAAHGGQQGVAGVDQLLHFGGAIDLVAGDDGAGQCAVDEAQVGAVNARHAGLHIGVQVGRGAGVAGGVALNGLQRRAVVGHGLGDQRLQFVQAVHCAAVVGAGGQRRHDGAQVVVGHTRDAQIGPLGGIQRRCAAAGHGHHPVDQIGHGFEFGHGVGLHRGFLTQQVVEQGQAAALQGRCRVHHGAHIGAQAGQLAQRHTLGGCGVGQGAIGFGQHEAVGVYQGLNLGHGVHLGACDTGGGQGAVDAAQQSFVGVAIGQGQAADRQRQVVADGGHGAAVVVGIGFNARDRLVVGVNAFVDFGLQQRQCLNGAAVAGRSGHGRQRGGQVGVAQPLDANGQQFGAGQGRCGWGAGGGAQQAVDHAGQLVDFVDGVHTTDRFERHQIVEQAQTRRAGGNATQCHTDALIAGDFWCVAGRAFCMAQHRLVSADDGLHFGGAVGLCSGHGCAGQRRAHGAEVGAGDTGDTGRDKVCHSGCGQRAVAGIRRNQRQCVAVGLCAAGCGAGHIGQAVHGLVSSAGVGQRFTDGGQLVGVGLVHTQRAQVVQGDGGRRVKQAVDHRHQRLDLSHGVYAGCGACAHHVVQQCQSWGFGCNGTQGHTNGLVIGSAGVVVGRGVDRLPIGFGQDEGVGVDHRLDVAGGVGLSTGDRCAAHGVVHGGQQHGVFRAIGQCQPGHAGLQIGQQGRRCAGVVLGVVADGVQRVGVVHQAAVDHILEFAQGVDVSAVVCAGTHREQGRAEVDADEALHAQAF